jgi:uncharacterized protein YbjQ (UPF0145 family)
VDQRGEGELERIRDESVRNLEEGRLPVEAERRLEALRGRPNFFTSGLTVSEFALSTAHGLRPVSQVMGSCVYHASVQTSWVSTGLGVQPGSIVPAPVISKPWNGARKTALQRLTMEAEQCGADAVVGVHLRRGESEFTPNSVEFIALGTAVRDKARPGDQRGTVLTGLSMQDYWKLLEAGHRVLGLVTSTFAVVCVPTATTQWTRSSGRMMGMGRQNREFSEFSAGIKQAVAGAAAEMREQATGLGAEGIVGVRIDRSHQFVSIRQGGYGGAGPDHREDLIVIVHALGTAIAAGEPRGAAAGEGGGAGGLRIQAVRHLDINRRQSP